MLAGPCEKELLSFGELARRPGVTTEPRNVYHVMT